MSVLKLGAHMSISGGLHKALERAASIGTNAVQIFTKNSRQWNGPPIDEEDVKLWHENKSKFGIEVAVSHASYLINLASPKDDIWQKSIHAHQDELERAAAYQISEVVVHPGAHTGSGEEKGLARIAEGLNQIHQNLPDITSTRTLLELTAGQGSNLGYQFSQLRQIIEQIEDKSRVGICVDTCHAFAAGYDLRNKAGYDIMIAEIEQEIGLEHLKCWHLNDSKHDLGSRKDRHEHIGEGNIGDAGFRFILNDSRWIDIPLLLETPKNDDLKEDIMNLTRLCSLVTDQSRIPEGLK